MVLLELMHTFNGAQLVNHHYGLRPNTSVTKEYLVKIN